MMETLGDALPKEMALVRAKRELDTLRNVAKAADDLMEILCSKDKINTRHPTIEILILMDALNDWRPEFEQFQKDNKRAELNRIFS
jgi:hypothetical protein